ncbi:MAG: branched-chain amino acid ABC transporter [Neisseria sp.]|nr:branched-chain amino acid ABC transporter [Neisseria sp.]
MNDHQQALSQIDRIIARLRANQSAECALAEAEDAELIRLNNLRFRLRPEDTALFKQIDALYRRHFPETEQTS